MGRIISLFSKLDAAVQRRFDSICFFLMRRFGVRKSSIRYALNALIILAFACDLGIQMQYGIVSPFTMFIGGLFILMMLLTQHFGVRDDREAEAKPGTASAADRWPDQGPWKAAASVLLVSTVSDFWYPPSEYVKAGLNGGQHVFPTFCEIHFWLSYLAWMYLKKTPMNPPPEEAREPVFAPQPAPIKS